jgi:hypothetical protein
MPGRPKHSRKSYLAKLERNKKTFGKEEKEEKPKKEKKVKKESKVKEESNEESNEESKEE